MKVLVIGQSSYDITAELNEAVVENKKYRIEKTFECPGGPAFNAACLLGKWGIDVYLISRINNDANGVKMKKFALEHNVNIDYLIDDSKRATPFSNIFIHNGNRTIFNFVEPLNEIKFNLPLEDVNIILSDGQEPEITMQMFAKYPNAIKVMDAGSYRIERMCVAHAVDYLIVSKQFAQGYTNLEINESNYEQALCLVEKINSKAAIITLGEDGLIYRLNDKLALKSAYKTHTVDSTGAGDVFHGCFVYCLAKGYSYEKSLSFSSLTAAISTERKGSSVSIPELKEVKQRQEKEKRI